VTGCGKDTVIFDDGRRVLRYIADHRGMVYLWNNGQLVGAMNYNYWCRCINKLPGACTEEDLDRMAEDIIAMSEKCTDKAELLEELHGLSRLEAMVTTLSDSGMDGMPIAMKLGIPFSEVMALKQIASEKMRSSVRGIDMKLDRKDKGCEEIETELPRYLAEADKERGGPGRPLRHLPPVDR
jgi:hypothetical protein